MEDNYPQILLSIPYDCKSTPTEESVIMAFSLDMNEYGVFSLEMDVDDIFAYIHLWIESNRKRTFQYKEWMFEQREYNRKLIQNTPESARGDWKI